MANMRSPEAVARRAAGKLTVQVEPEVRALAERLAVGHPGGLSGLITALVQQRAHLRAANGKRRAG